MENSLPANLGNSLRKWFASVRNNPDAVMREMVAQCGEVDQGLDWIEAHPDLDEAVGIHEQLSNILAVLGLYFAGNPLVTRLTWRAYEVSTTTQARASRRFNAGMNLFNVGRLAYLQGDYTTGLRQIVAALAEDIYGNRDNPDWVRRSNAYQFLAAHGMNDEMRAALTERIPQVSNDPEHRWVPEDTAYFEPTVEKFLISTAGEVGFNHIYWQSLVSSAKAAEKRDKGLALERAATYLMSQIDGLLVIDRDTRTRTTEWDILCRFVKPNQPLQWIFGTHMVAECKNLKRRCSSSVIRNFAYKILGARVNGGVLVALGGISGDLKKDDNAWGEVSRAFRQHGITIVVITEEEIRKIATRKQIVDLILRHAEDIRFERMGGGI